MSEPVILKNSFAIAVIAVLQTLAPAIIAVISFYTIMRASGIKLDEYYHSTALLAGLLTLLLPRAPRNLHSQLLATSVPIALGVVTKWMVVLCALLVIGYLTKFSAHYSRRAMLIWAVLTPGLIVAATLALLEILRRYLRDPDNARRTVLAGCTGSSLALAARLKRCPEFGMPVVGFFDDRGRERLKVNGDVQLLGRLSDLPAYVRQHNIAVIFIALPMREVCRVMDLVEELRDTTASIYYLPDIFVFDLVQARSISIDGIPALSMCETPLFGYRAIAKRATDVLISGAMLTLAAPLMVVIAALVKASSPGPIIFRQRRYGLNGDEIIVYKFRTMTVTEDGSTIVQATRADPRTTRIGNFLRRYSLDELPQLINVLQGRMSLVGPRPHAVAHNEMYRRLIKGYMVRHKVRPGITGLAQVNGLRGETRTLAQMEARVRYDLEYLRNWSLELDLEILAKTALRVFSDAEAF
jgi:Undecaprenyl-phosphate glucose phosphotransferase